MRPRRLLAALATVAAVAGLAVTTGAAPAGAGQGTGNPVLTVSPKTVSASGTTTLTVKGTDYLVPPHAAGKDVFGGVYLFFGWVSNPSHFGPSIRSSTGNQGTFGVSYAYPGDGGDPSTRSDPEGKMRLVSFTAGGESGSATSFHMDDNGNWTATINVYGSTFTTTDPVTRATKSFDCQKVQCGVFTIGAHGKASATNERFTPITFTGAPAPGATGGSGSGSTGGSGGSGTGSAGGSSGGSGGTGSAGAAGANSSNGGPAGATNGAGSSDGSSGSGSGASATTAPKVDAKAATTTTVAPLGTTIVEEGDGSADEVAAGTKSETSADGVEVSSTRSTGGSSLPVLLGGALVVAVAIGGGLFWRRRHKGPEPAP